MTTLPLTAQARTAALDALRASGQGGPELDVLVVGGGVTGAGIALDAAGRGLSTAIVEAQDWASGTSSRSSKLVHGGLRYLAMFDFHLVHEALVERDLLVTTLAPHLVHPVSFLYPLTHHVWERAYVGAGVALYDALATATGTRRAMPFHRHLSRTAMRRLFPDLHPRAAVGAVRYWDAQVDDARLVGALVRTAVSQGALAASRTQVVGLTTSESGSVTGAVLLDTETGERFAARARHVIAATGVWTEQTEALAGTGGLEVLASKGVHLVVPRDRIAGDVGLILQTEKSVLFLIPWPRHWVIGTTDTPWDQELRHPVATREDVDYVLEHANAVLARPLSRDDVVGVFAGLRPLLQPRTKAGTSSAKVSREHTVASPAPGLTVIAGGKLTTYRVMAKDAVDFAIGAQQAAVHPSTTRHLPLAGAEGLAEVTARAEDAGARLGWDAARVRHLLGRYGSLLDELVALVDARPDLAAPLAGAPAYTRAEVVYAVTHEGALHLDDVLMHRIRLNHEQVDRGLAVLEEAVDLVGPLLGWDAATRGREVQAYRERVAAEEAAALEDDDASAAAVRLAATDVAPMADLGTASARS